jgi:hypothetical protein
LRVPLRIVVGVHVYIDDCRRPDGSDGGQSATGRPAVPRGFGYASFLLGYPSSVALALPAHPRLGMHSIWLQTAFTFSAVLITKHAKLPIFVPAQPARTKQTVAVVINS